MSSDKANKSLSLLKQGNKRFVEARLNHPNQDATRRKHSALNGQDPFAIVLACSDSRVPVELLFDTGIGDIFVVRNAGNIAGNELVLGSLEYAAAHLHVPLLVILGHSNCGAVNAALTKSPAKGHTSTIQNTISPLAAEIQKEQPSLNHAELIQAVVKANVIQSKTALLTQSEIIKNLADSGSIKVINAIYDTATGEIEWL